MIVTSIALIVLLMCILFIKSTIIIERGKPERPTKVNILIPIICALLAFVPVANWIIMFLAPIVTIIWYGTSGFDDFNSRTIELNEETPIGKILLFKI